MQTAPEVGKTYKSQTEPDFLLYVEDVHAVDAKDGDPATFCVEACEPPDIGDMGAIGYDLTEDEWNAHGFIPESA